MFLLLVRRLDGESRTWGEWLPHSAYATEQEVQEVCFVDVIDNHHMKYIKLSNQIKSGSTTDLKTVLGSQCHWLTKGTKVKIIAGSREGIIGYIVEVLHLSVQGCIYRVVPTKGMCGIDSQGYYYTQEQVVEYTQVEFCSGGGK